MQKSFLLGVLLTSIGLTTIGSDTPIRPLTTLTQPNSGKTLSADDHSPFANGHSPFNDYGPTDSKSPDQQQYPTPDERARLFEENQRDKLRNQPIGFYVEYHKRCLAEHEAILATFIEMIDDENAARLELEKSYEQSKNNLITHLNFSRTEYANYIREQREIKAKTLKDYYDYPPALLQPCPVVTGKCFNVKTLETCDWPVQWLDPKDLEDYTNKEKPISPKEPEETNQEKPHKKKRSTI